MFFGHCHRTRFRDSFCLASVFEMTVYLLTYFTNTLSQEKNAKTFTYSSIPGFVFSVKIWAVTEEKLKPLNLRTCMEPNRTHILCDCKEVEPKQTVNFVEPGYFPSLLHILVTILMQYTKIREEN